MIIPGSAKMDESKIIEIIAKYEKHKEQNRMAAKRFYYKNRDDPEFQARRRAYYQRTKEKQTQNEQKISV